MLLFRYLGIIFILSFWLLVTFSHKTLCFIIIRILSMHKSHFPFFFFFYCFSFPVPYGQKWRRQWQPTPVFLPGKSHGRQSLVGHCPWGRKESDTTERREEEDQSSNLADKRYSLEESIYMNKGRRAGWSKTWRRRSSRRGTEYL